MLDMIKHVVTDNNRSITVHMGTGFIVRQFDSIEQLKGTIDNLQFFYDWINENNFTDDTPVKLPYLFGIFSDDLSEEECNNIMDRIKQGE